MTIPSDIAGLLAWYDPSKSSSVHLVGGQVNQLDDLSGNARHLTAPDAALRPDVTTWDSAAGLQMLSCGVGSGQGLDIADFMPSGAGSVTLFGVVKMSPSASVAATWASHGDGASAGSGGAGSNYGLTNGEAYLLDDGFGGDFTSFSAHVPAIWSAVMVSGAPKLYIDGGLEITGNKTHNWTAGQRFTLGGRLYSGGVFADPGNCLIGEVIAYTGALSDVDRQAIERYLTAKWFPGPHVAGVGANAPGHTATLTPGLPINHMKNDVLVAVVTGRPSGTAGVNDDITFPAGWTQAGVTVRQEIGTDDLALAVFYKTDGGSETDPTITAGTAFQGIGTEGWSAAIFSVRGAYYTDPLDVGWSADTSGASTTFTGSNSGTTTNGALAIVVAATGDDNSITLFTTQNFDNVLYGSRYDATDGSDHSKAVFVKNILTAPTFSMPQLQQTINGPDAWADLVLVFTPDHHIPIVNTANDTYGRQGYGDSRSNSFAQPAAVYNGNSMAYGHSLYARFRQLSANATQITDTETITGADTQLTFTASFTDTDTSTGADTEASFTAAFSDTETAAGADTEVNISQTDTEIGAGADAGETISATLSGTDTGTGADTEVNIAQTDTETGSGADAGESIAVTLSDTETASGADTEINISLSDTETGAGADAGESIAATASDADTGSGADTEVNISLSDTEPIAGVDAGESIAATLSDTETATGADTEGTIALSGTDTGSGADAGEAISAALSDVDVASGADTEINISLSDTDTLTSVDADGSESASVGDPDTVTGSDAGETVTLSDADTGSGVDAGEAITAQITDTDLVSGADAEVSIALSDTETSAGTDAGEVTSATLSDAETATGADTEVSIALSDSDTGSGVDDGSVAISGASVDKSDSDTVSGTDAETSLLATTSDTETGAGADTETLIGISDSDTAAAVDTEISANATLADSDIGSGVDTESTIALNDTDTASGLDAVARQELLDSETVVGVDAFEQIGLSDADITAFLDAQETIGLSDSDSGTEFPDLDDWPGEDEFPGGTFDFDDNELQIEVGTIVVPPYGLIDQDFTQGTDHSSLTASSPVIPYCKGDNTVAVAGSITTAVLANAGVTTVVLTASLNEAVLVNTGATSVVLLGSTSSAVVDNSILLAEAVC